MRIELQLFVPTALLAFGTACGSVWVPVDYNPIWAEECVDQIWYPDADSDGWGFLADGEEPKIGCVPEGQYKARNDLDCDDGNPEITAKLGAICPDQLVAGMDETDVTVLVGSSAEYAIVKATADTNYALHAEAACAAWGNAEYPGKLATFSDAGEFSAVRDALGTAKYAAFIGVGQDTAGSACSEGGVCWKWTDDSTLAFSALGNGWCDGVVADNAWLDRVALVTNGGGSFCLGTPDLVGYAWNEAQFICERPIPAEVDFEYWPPAQ